MKTSVKYMIAAVLSIGGLIAFSRDKFFKVGRMASAAAPTPTLPPCYPGPGGGGPCDPNLPITTPTPTPVPPTPTPLPPSPTPTRTPIPPTPTPTKTPTPAKTPTPDLTPTVTPLPTVTVGGEFGASVPVISEPKWLREGDQFAIIAGAKEDQYFRSNLGLTWRGGNVQYRIEFYKPDGTWLYTYFDQTLAHEDKDDGVYQYNHVIRLADKTYRGMFTMKFVIEHGPGQLYFYVAINDNVTNDASVLGQYRFAKDGTVWGPTGKQ